MDLFAYLLSKKSKPGKTITGEGTSIALENTSANQIISMSLAPSELEQRNLPSEYTQVEWLKPSGVITITGFKTKSTQEITTVFYRERSGAAYLYASDTNTSGTTNTTAYLTSGAGNWRWDGKSYSISVSTGIMVTSIQKNDGVWLNGTKSGWYSDTEDFVSTNDLRLSSSENTTIRIYSLTVRESDTITLDLVPVQKVSDSTYGFYDKVSGNFYTNADAPFTAGSVIVPSPDYPQDVHTISGNNTIKIEGKNILDMNNSLEAYTSGSTGEIISISGGLCYWAKVKPNQTYTYSREKGDRLMILGSNTQPAIGNYMTVIVDDGNSTETVKTFTNGNFTYILIYTARYTTSQPAWAQLEEGTTVSNYVPYVEPQNAPLNLGTEEYCKIGNYSDDFYLATSSDTTLEEGKWYLKKNIGKVVLDGTQGGASVGTNSKGIKYYYILKNDKVNGGTVLSNNFEQLSSLWTLASYTNCIVTEANNKIISIMTSDDTITDLTAFNNFFSSNNTIIYYPLETPTYTLLDNTLQTQLTNIYSNVLSYEGQTNISQVNSDLPFIISATISSKSEVKIDLLNYILLEDEDNINHNYDYIKRGC